MLAGVGVALLAHVVIARPAAVHHRALLDSAVATFIAVKLGGWGVESHQAAPALGTALVDPAAARAAAAVAAPAVRGCTSRAGVASKGAS